MNTAETKKALLKRVVMALLLALALIMASNTALAGTIFSDDFTGSTLNPAWQVLPGQGVYAVGGGNLRYYNNGPVASTTGWYNPALTLALPFSGTNWEIDTKATYSLGWCASGSYTGPPNPNQACSSGAQGPEVLVKFNPGVTTSGFGGPNYAGTDYAVYQRTIDAYYGANTLSASYGSVSNGNLLNRADTDINNNIADGTYWYQIIRTGGALTMNYSYNGVTFLTAFSTTLSDPSSSYNELLLGGITYSTAGSYTDYAYVNITAPSAVPEPSTWGLLGLGLLVLLPWSRRAGSWLLPVWLARPPLFRRWASSPRRSAVGLDKVGYRKSKMAI